MNDFETIQQRINYMYTGLTEIRRNVSEIVHRTPSTGDFYLNYDQRFMIDLYTNMYNTTLRQIDFLHQELESSRERTNVVRNSYRSRFFRQHRTNFSRDMNTLFSEAIRNMSFPDLTPVTVAPTTEQLARATRNIRFGDVENPPNARCPIRLEPFHANTVVTQIIHCRHCFHSEECVRWFEYSVRCPVCRYDVRTINEESEPLHYESPSDEQNVDTDTEEQEESPNISSEINSWYYGTTDEQRNIANVLTQTISNFVDTHEFAFDASNSMIIYDAIFRARV